MDSQMKQIVRERQTEERIRAMDAPEIVDEIHALEDRIEELEAEAAYNALFIKATDADNRRLQSRIEELEGRYDALKAALTYDDGDVIRTSVKGDSDVTDIINQIESEFNDLL